MLAYLIVDTAIENADAYENYKARAQPIAEQYGGVYRVLGGTTHVVFEPLDFMARLAVWCQSPGLT